MILKICTGEIKFGDLMPRVKGVHVSSLDMRVLNLAILGRKCQIAKLRTLPKFPAIIMYYA